MLQGVGPRIHLWIDPSTATAVAAADKVDMNTPHLLGIDIFPDGAHQIIFPQVAGQGSAAGIDQRRAASAGGAAEHD